MLAEMSVIILLLSSPATPAAPPAPAESPEETRNAAPDAVPSPPRFWAGREGPAVWLALGDGRLLEAPPEGLWSIAFGWRDGWPAEWRHASPASVGKAGDWTILQGRVEGPGGAFEVRDAYRAEGARIRGVRRFTWKGDAPVSRVTLSVRFRVPGSREAQVVLPGILYNGNPSGARSGRVPVYGGRPGELAIFEEHRFPLPFASVEHEAGGRRWGAALHSIPSPVPGGHLADQWWSLGVEAVQTAESAEAGQELLLLSGPCASSGKRSVIKAVQTGFIPYEDAWITVEPGTVIEKTFFLEVFPVAAEGSGFRRPLRTSIDIFRPLDADRFPSAADILRAKVGYAWTRWIDEGPVAGFQKYPDRPFFVMGWCGQADALGYAFQVLGPEVGGPRALEAATRSLDFLSTSPFYESGFRTWYNHETGEWSGHEILSQGQAMQHFAHAVRVGRSRGAATGRWEEFLRKACDLHSRRILAAGWRPPSTSEAFLVAPLCLSSQVLDELGYLEAAVKAGEHFGARHLSMREPYWGGTLDASCEDKEGAYAAFQAFLALHERTGEARFLDWARHACDVVLSYVVVWDIDMPPGRLRDHAFRSTGWTVVSPQNQHVDVYGVTMVPDVFRLGQITGDETLRRLALVLYRSCGQLIDPVGSQGEQPQHTNYTQAARPNDPRGLRGGYNETWTVFWITAHFLSAAARLRELGVEM